jgi:hypothetical protein
MDRRAAAEYAELLSGIDEMGRRMGVSSNTPEPELVDALATCLGRMSAIYAMRFFQVEIDEKADVCSLTQDTTMESRSASPARIRDTTMKSRSASPPAPGPQTTSRSAPPQDDSSPWFNADPRHETRALSGASPAKSPSAASFSRTTRFASASHFSTGLRSSLRRASPERRISLGRISWNKRIEVAFIIPARDVDPPAYILASSGINATASAKSRPRQQPLFKLAMQNSLKKWGAD